MLQPSETAALRQICWATQLERTYQLVQQFRMMVQQHQIVTTPTPSSGAVIVYLKLSAVLIYLDRALEAYWFFTSPKTCYAPDRI